MLSIVTFHLEFHKMVFLTLVLCVSVFLVTGIEADRSYTVVPGASPSNCTGSSSVKVLASAMLSSCASLSPSLQLQLLCTQTCHQMLGGQKMGTLHLQVGKPCVSHDCRPSRHRVFSILYHHYNFSSVYTAIKASLLSMDPQIEQYPWD